MGAERLLERAVRVAMEAGCEPVVVVLGARAGEVEAGCELRGARVLLNVDWAEGMGSSVRVGVRALADEVDACVVLACDQPAVTATHLRKLMSREGAVVASAYAGRHGVPACFGAELFPELLELRGDRGAREVLQGAEAVELPGGEVDVDTVESLVEARARFGGLAQGGGA